MDSKNMDSKKSWRRYGGAAGLVAAGVVAGGVLAGTLTASADDSTTGTGTDSSTTRSSGDPSQPQRSDEELLTGDTLTQVEKAVLAEYPDATIERTETDSGGVYESHVVTADGERLTVLVGEDFVVTGTETGGHGGGGHRGGAPGESSGD
jgi:hypothetical protein